MSRKVPSIFHFDQMTLTKMTAMVCLFLILVDSFLFRYYLDEMGQNQRYFMGASCILEFCLQFLLDISCPFCVMYVEKSVVFLHFFFGFVINNEYLCKWNYLKIPKYDSYETSISNHLRTLRPPLLSDLSCKRTNRVRISRMRFTTGMTETSFRRQWSMSLRFRRRYGMTKVSRIMASTRLHQEWWDGHFTNLGCLLWASLPNTLFRWRG